MKTIVLSEPGKFAVVSTEAPRAQAGEALVRVHRVGICGTDLHAYRGKQPFFSYPRVLGHELGVEVISAPANDRGIKARDRCAVEPYLNCGRCIACRRGRGNCCENMRVLGVHIDGGMREQFALPVSKLHKSEKLSLDQLALVETLGIGAHAVQRGQVERGERVLVIGAGPIGLSVIQFAIEAGARVMVMDISDDRLAFCRSQLGVAATIKAGDDALERVKAANDGELPTAVFDATGNPGSMMKSFDFVAHAGRLVFVGLFQGDVTFHDPLFHRREMTILASRNALPADFGRIIASIEAGRIDTTPWITHRASADAMIGSFDSWLDPASRCLKAMVAFD